MRRFYDKEDLERLIKNTFMECRRALGLLDKTLFVRLGCCSRNKTVWIWNVAEAASCGDKVPIYMGAYDRRYGGDPQEPGRRGPSKRKREKKAEAPDTEMNTEEHGDNTKENDKKRSIEQQPTQCSKKQRLLGTMTSCP